MTNVHVSVCDCVHNFYYMYAYIGCPTIVRSDRGTENCNVEFLQPFLREACNDTLQGKKSFIYGKSTTNQVCICLTSCDLMHLLLII